MGETSTVLLMFDCDVEAFWEGAYGVAKPSALSRGGIYDWAGCEGRR